MFVYFVMIKNGTSLFTFSPLKYQAVEVECRQVSPLQLLHHYLNGSLYGKLKGYLDSPWDPLREWIWC